MEIRHVEVTRFARRAADYKKALQLAPEARALELAAVVNVVLGLCDKNKWRPSDVRVVDLMAGSGVLTRALLQSGFTHVIPIEACCEMRPDDSKDLGYMNGNAFAELRLTLAQLKPDIIVSLAGFHHLLEYNGTVVDRGASLASQLEMIEACVAGSNPGGYLVIVDISEVANPLSTTISPVDAWSGGGLREVRLLAEEESKTLMKSRSLEDFSRQIESIFGHVDRDCPVHWFRKVVDAKTKLGHKDFAISEALLRTLALYYSGSVRASSFCCPWLFESGSSATQFILHKFGFLVDRDEELDIPALGKDMMTYLGVEDSASSRVALKWALCGIVIRHEPEVGTFYSVPVLNILLLSALALLVARIVCRVSYASDAVDETLGGLFWLSCGAALGVLIDVLKSRTAKH